MDKEKRIFVLVVVGVLAFVFLFGFLIVGPAGFNNSYASWKARAYGSDWLIVQYAQDGSVISSWDLKDCSVKNESASDGIYFTSGGSVKHLSGHYIYIQNPTDEDRKKVMKK